MKKFDEKTYALALRIDQFNRSHGKDGNKDSILLAAAESGYTVWYHDYPAPCLITTRGPLDEAVTAIMWSEMHRQKRRPMLTVQREKVVDTIKTYAETAHHRATQTAHQRPNGEDTNEGWLFAEHSPIFKRAQEAAGELNGACNALSFLFGFWVEINWKPLSPYVSLDGKTYFPSSYATPDKVTIHWTEEEAETVFLA